ncbi:MAG TPA: hypothetical protein DEA08_27855 [Planctomycetes bacterium]|nr:hypothetical protein [Planctomycetota bacterium]
MTMLRFAPLGATAGAGSLPPLLRQAVVSLASGFLLAGLLALAVRCAPYTPRRPPPAAFQLYAGLGSALSLGTCNYQVRCGVGFAQDLWPYLKIATWQLVPTYGLWLSGLVGLRHLARALSCKLRERLPHDRRADRGPLAP